MSKTTPSGDIPTPFATEGSPPGEDWQEVRDADTGELLAYGRRLDGPEAERLGQVMQSMPIAAGPGLDRTTAPTSNGSGSDDAPLLFGGKPMPAGHFHFALPLPKRVQAPDGNDDDGDNDDNGDTDEEDLRAERARLRHEQKEQRHQDKMRERTARVVRNARSERKAHRKAETKRKRIRSGKRSLNRRR